MSILLLFLLPISLEAVEVSAVKGYDIKPYNDALKGFKSACQCSVAELSPEDEDFNLKIKNMSPEVVFTIGTKALRMAAGLKGVQVVYSMVMPADTVYPLQGHVSGVSMEIPPELYVSRIAELFPQAKRIGVVFDPENTGPFVKRATAAAADRGMTIVSRVASGPGNVPALLNELRNRVDVLWMVPDTTVINSETASYMLLFSYNNKLPLMSFSRKYVELGAVAALGIDFYDMGVQAGEITRKILERNTAGTPVRVSARKTYLIVNTKMAEKLGVSLGKEILRRAERVD